MAPSAPDPRREFEALAEGLDASLFAAARRLCREDASARDLVQDTWYRAFRSFHLFERGTSFRAWIFRIQWNLFLNARRRARLEPRPSDFAAEEPPDRAVFAEIETSGEGLDRLFDRHVSGEVRRAVDDLPEEFRAVIVLTALGGLSYEETARVIGCPPGTVMSRLFRARRRLRAALRGWAEREGVLRAPAGAAGGADGVSGDRSRARGTGP